MILLMERSETNRSRGKRVLLAMELRSYRQALAAVLRHLFPDVSFFEVDPADLDRETALLLPDLVMCSKITNLVEGLVPNWVELYPDHGFRSIVSLRGVRSTLDGAQLSDLVSVVDRLDPAASL